MSDLDCRCQRWTFVVPILFLDFLVLALPGGVLPIVINEAFGQRSYLLTGCAHIPMTPTLDHAWT